MIIFNKINLHFNSLATDIVHFSLARNDWRNSKYRDFQHFLENRRDFHRERRPLIKILSQRRNRPARPPLETADFYQIPPRSYRCKYLITCTAIPLSFFPARGVDEEWNEREKGTTGKKELLETLKDRVSQVSSLLRRRSFSRIPHVRVSICGDIAAQSIRIDRRAARTPRSTRDGRTEGRLVFAAARSPSRGGLAVTL